ncbi:hypothetical protein PGB90_003185 [Kerria lacca]
MWFVFVSYSFVTVFAYPQFSLHSTNENENLYLQPIPYIYHSSQFQNNEANSNQRESEFQRSIRSMPTILNAGGSVLHPTMNQNIEQFQRNIRSTAGSKFSFLNDEKESKIEPILGIIYGPVFETTLDENRIPMLNKIRSIFQSQLPYILNTRNENENLREEKNIRHPSDQQIISTFWDPSENSNLDLKMFRSIDKNSLMFQPHLENETPFIRVNENKNLEVPKNENKIEIKKLSKNTTPQVYGMHLTQVQSFSLLDNDEENTETTKLTPYKSEKEVKKLVFTDEEENLLQNLALMMMDQFKLILEQQKSVSQIPLHKFNKPVIELLESEDFKPISPFSSTFSKTIKVPEATVANDYILNDNKNEKTTENVPSTTSGTVIVSS